MVPETARVADLPTCMVTDGGTTLSEASVATGGAPDARYADSAARWSPARLARRRSGVPGRATWTVKATSRESPGARPPNV